MTGGANEKMRNADKIRIPETTTVHTVLTSANF